MAAPALRLSTPACASYGPPEPCTTECAWSPHSLLVKNLGIHWRHGEQWFWDTIVDADPAANPFNWQWVAGSGDDAAPYFRIFNPDTQARRFDPDGTYRNRWLPIMSADYPEEAIVDLKESRLRALDAYNACKR